VAEALPKTEQVLLEGINVATHHEKSRRTRSTGQVVKRSAPVHVSNVSLVDGKKAVRAGYKVEKDGDKTKKVRVARPSGKTI
jgi:large subunit ribosomal protein L24